MNSTGLPTSVFRTDDFPLTTTGAETLADSSSISSYFNIDETNERYREMGYEVLFNGHNLDGWKNPYDHGTARAVNGEIHLLGDKKFFLVTEESYENFQLIVEIHLPEGQANSGVMFRANVEPGKVYGYQAECDGSDRRWSGGLYDEGRRKWLWPSKSGNTEDEKFLAQEKESQAYFQKPEVRDALKRNDWNTYKILCNNDHIRIEVNGVVTTDVRDAMDKIGPIGIQHHGEKGQLYRFRKILLKKM